jgi:hypothetical protein
LLGAILEDVNASCCRFIWAHDGVDNDADGIRRIQTGNGAGIIKAVDSRLENGTISANPRAVELRLRSQGGYGRVCTFELAYSAQRWHNGKKVGEKERDAAQAALSGEIGEPCFLNCGEYLLVKMLQENLCSKDELQALASAVAQRRSGLKRRFRNLMAASDWRRLQSDDELPLPDATLPDFDTWQNRRQIHHQINAQDAGGSLPSSEVSKHRGDGENDLIGEALDPSRSLTHRFYWREPQRGDIAWVMEGVRTK